ncbi:MAG: hypothetical protein HXS54_11265, partial [Theionarchaea archaeon]|nr:hypothetical protein [Theionarchaea archaeon]
MEQQYEMNDREKELLNALGRYPSLSVKELLTHTHYKRMSSILRKIEQFREKNLLWGPTHPVDYGRLCRNPLQRLFCIMELNRSYETVISYLELIEPLIWTYPVLSHRELLCVSFVTSNDQEVIALLQLLKDNNIITDFDVRLHCNSFAIETPNFFGDPVPSLNNLLAPCKFPDITFGKYDTEWNECDIATLSYLHGEHKVIKLVEILRRERLRGKPWTYSQIKYSYRKMCKKKLIEKTYFVHPFPLDQCSDFFLFMKADDKEMTKRILYNFARGERIFREYTLFDEWGLIGCISHPQFVLDLMYKLDQIDEIKEKTLYHLRSFPP